MRNQSIDTFRFISIIFIVTLHTSSLAFSPTISGEILNHFARFAVPFFFSIAGFLFYKKLRDTPYQILNTTQKYIFRIGYVYFFWYILYAAFPFYSPSNWTNIQNHGLSFEINLWLTNFIQAFSKQKMTYLFAGGRAFHLWFLPSLCMAITILAISVHFKKFYVGLLFAAVLFLIALIGGPYKATPLGLDIGVEPRNGPFFSTIFVFLGALIGKLEIRKSIFFSISLILLGFSISLVEIFVLKEHFGLVISNCSYVFGTLIFSGGVTLLVLSNENCGTSLGLSRFGKLTMGIYLSHVLIIWLLESVNLWPSNDLTKLLLCLILSMLFTKLISLVPILRKTIS